jgi:lipopolysaccharide transport system ATP-binding protein
MSSDIAIQVEDLGKCYQIYDTPRDRLKQFLLPPIRRSLGLRAKQYHRNFWALQHVSFEVKRGETVGIIGRNGSGKSTLLQIVTGTLAPTVGTVKTKGRIAALLELGSGFNPDFTGRENVYLNGALLGFSSRQLDEKFDAIAAFADIGEHLEQPVKTYSSGMLVRLAFAVQVQVEPEVLIVDEALAVGDALFQKRCYQSIEKLVSNGTAVLFVSHDQESVRTLTNRAVLLNSGTTLSIGPSSTVVLEYRKLLHDQESRYISDLTKQLTEKARSQNLLPAQLRREPSEGVSTRKSVLDKSNHSNQLSFGDGEVSIVNVQTLNEFGQPCSVFSPGHSLRIRVTCAVNEDICNLSVIVRLRNKEGVKIYSWGTLNQDIQVWAQRAEAPIFWERKFKKGDQFEVEFGCIARLGENLYEVQAAVTHEEAPNYRAQRMLHWIDEAAFFQVAMERDVHLFSGVLDLNMKASWSTND